MLTGSTSAPPVRSLVLSPRDSSELLSPTGPFTPTSTKGAGTSALSSKIVSVLSTSYADTEFREALFLLDERGLQNAAENRRKLRLDLQKEVIDSNGEIIHEFGKVAEVCVVHTTRVLITGE